MSSRDLLGMAVRNLFKRKLRTFLTVLGVIIGTTAIVTMISLGIAVNESFMDRMDEMGDITMVSVFNPNSNQYSYMSNWDEYSSIQTDRDLVLDDSVIAKFKLMPGVMAATPIMEINLKSVVGKYTSWLNIRGIDSETMGVMGYEVETGTLLDSEVRYGIVFGNSVSRQYSNPSDRRRRDFRWGEQEVDLMEGNVQMSFDWSFGEENPNYDSTARPYKLKSLGILKSKGYSTDYYAFMDIQEVREIKKAQEKYEQDERGGNNDTWGGTAVGSQKSKGYDSALIKCIDMKDVDGVKVLVEEMGFYAETLTQYLESMQGMAASLQGLLGAIGGVSLFVAAIGIANTMIMAIYERTREIGVMKVIGASIRDIKRLFLLEAMMIGFLGGSLGVALSLVISHVMNEVGISFFDMITWGEQAKVSVVPPWLCLVALGFASVIGLISGYFPARRAMKLSALTAIRTE